MSEFYQELLEGSEKFKKLRNDCRSALKASNTGITNLIVNYEDASLVEAFMTSCFKNKELYRETNNIDAVELQRNNPGSGSAAAEVDQIIFGTFRGREDTDTGDIIVDLDPRTGERLRNQDGFVSRPEAKTRSAKDTILVIRNIDNCLDFCDETRGVFGMKYQAILDNFRNAEKRLGLRLLLVTNKPLELPFKVRRVYLEPVDLFEANHIVDGFKTILGQRGIVLDISENQEEQICRKIVGLTYTEAGDILAEAIGMSREIKGGDNIICSQKLVKEIRNRVNRNMLQDGNGLSCLTPKPWEDYICPESSDFTYDLKKILRDFDEIEDLKSEGETDLNLNLIEAIRSRMPHVILLYGKGGVGKSAFAAHFAGLLEFDAWNFNVGGSHSKYVGEGAERMRGSLDRVTNSSHVVIRMDEYDRAMGSGGKGEGDMHTAHRQVESELMNWLQDQQEENTFVKKDIFVIITTNHKDHITGPLLRSGRIDLVINIADFDTKSIKEAFISAPRRMGHRGVSIVGFKDQSVFENAINSLDLDKISEVARDKGFTVRDIDVLLQEMGAHNYYFHKYSTKSEKSSGKSNKGLIWNTDNFLKVLENSTGSVSHEETGELDLGDKEALMS